METSNSSFCSMRRLKPNVKLGLIIIFVVVGLLLVGWFIYKVGTSRVSKNAEIKEIIVESGSSYLTIASQLKESNLIRSELFYKLYIKLHNPTPVQAGKYSLSENMNVKQLVNVLSSGSTYNPDAVTVTFKEGINMREIAKIISEKTNNTEEDVFMLLNDNSYLDELIDEYWFIGNEINDNRIYYSLEGYLFPDTYELLNKDVTVREIFKIMLDQMDSKLSLYKEEIENSKYSIHEILTLASIIQTEGNNDSDWDKISGVFHNRLDTNETLGSCVTIYYGVKRDFGTGALWQYEIDDNNPYNTRMYAGLPIGPIATISEKVLKSTLNPAETDYLYFISDANRNTYFFEDIGARDRKIEELRAAGLYVG